MCSKMEPHFLELSLLAKPILTHHAQKLKFYETCLFWTMPRDWKWLKSLYLYPTPLMALSSKHNHISSLIFFAYTLFWSDLSNIWKLQIAWFSRKIHCSVWSYIYSILHKRCYRNSRRSMFCFHLSPWPCWKSRIYYFSVPCVSMWHSGSCMYCFTIQTLKIKRWTFL